LSRIFFGGTEAAKKVKEKLEEGLHPASSTMIQKKERLHRGRRGGGGRSLPSY